jgi:hypothetical protein
MTLLAQNTAIKMTLGRKRWLLYGLIGILFGVFDYFFQQLAQQDSSQVTQVVVVYGIWLVPLIPIAFYESRTSSSAIKSALASAFTWSLAIVAYYLYMAFELIIIGKDSLLELHFSSHQDPYYWSNLGRVFFGDISGGIVEWLALAVIGGGLIGFIIGLVYTHLIALRLMAEKKY